MSSKCKRIGNLCVMWRSRCQPMRQFVLYITCVFYKHNNNNNHKNNNNNSNNNKSAMLISCVELKMQHFVNIWNLKMRTTTKRFGGVNGTIDIDGSSILPPRIHPLSLPVPLNPTPLSTSCCVATRLLNNWVLRIMKFVFKIRRHSTSSPVHSELTYPLSTPHQPLRIG